MGDPHKIAFIACVNNEKEFDEACFYIDRLDVPAGYETDIIAVCDSESMASGYNAAMNSSDAKYKVYIHQDTFIINCNFIYEMLEVFKADATIGMLGMIGCDSLPLHAQAITSYNVGAVYSNNCPSTMILRQNDDCTSVTVEALDGLLIATQYDLPWRDDIFDGWDFYDVSQCFEMQRKGYRIVVPYQDAPWCYHDNTYSRMEKYYDYCGRFAGEYSDMKPFCAVAPSDMKKEFDALREESRNHMIDIVNEGKRDELCELFLDEGSKGYLHLREFEILADIETAEKCSGCTSHFWTDDDTYASLTQKIAIIRFAIKRVLFGADDGTSLNSVRKHFNNQAIGTVGRFYG